MLKPTPGAKISPILGHYARQLIVKLAATIARQAAREDDAAERDGELNECAPQSTPATARIYKTSGQSRTK
jgi:hypothetical protein